MDTLVAIGYQKFQVMSPKVWDTEAYTSFVNDSKKTGADDSAIAAAWKDVLAMARATLPKLYTEYEQTKNLDTEEDDIQWEGVEFQQGTNDGDTFLMIVNVGGERCEIECSAEQFCDVDFIIRKLEFQAIRTINCPYQSRRLKGNWKKAVVFKWLKHPNMIRSSRENISGAVHDAVLDYARRPIDAAALTKPWDQSFDAVREREFVYLPYNGLAAHVKKLTGRDISRSYITNVLSQLHAEVRKKGGGCNRFYAINYDKIVPANSEARLREAHSADSGSTGSAFPGWNGFSDNLREEEHGTHGAEDGLVVEGKTGSPKDTNAPLGSVAPSKAKKTGEPDEIPF